MGLFSNLVAKAYGKVLEGDYKGAKISAKWETDNYFYINPLIGKMLKITHDDIDSYEIQTSNAFGDTNVKVFFKDGKKSLIQFSKEGMDIFNRTTF